MSYEERVNLYRQVENIRGRPLLVYITSPRQGGNGGQMGSDVIPEFCEQISRISIKEKNIDLLVVSQGGDPIVPWRIMGILRERFKKIGFLVPYTAQSAATILAFGADEILMHPYACLGPNDPQITDDSDPTRPPRVFSVEDLKCFTEFMSDLKISETDFGKDSLNYLTKVLDPLSIGAAKKSMKLSENLASKLLLLHMKNEEKVDKIVEEYNNKAHHGYTISRSEAKSAGLPIKYPSKDLEELMWNIWTNAEIDLKCRIPFHPKNIILSSRGSNPNVVIEETEIAILESRNVKFACKVKAIIGVTAIPQQVGVVPMPQSMGIAVDVVPLGWIKTESEN